MNVGNYLQDQNGGNTVAFVGMERPWPEFPTTVGGRQGSVQQCVAGWSGTAIVPGERITQDFGWHISGDTILINIPWLSGATLAALNVLVALQAPIVFTSDAFGSTYLCSFTPMDKNPDVTSREGFSDTALADTVNGAYAVKIYLNVLGRLS